MLAYLVVLAGLAAGADRTAAESAEIAKQALWEHTFTMPIRRIEALEGGLVLVETNPRKKDSDPPTSWLLDGATGTVVDHWSTTAERVVIDTPKLVRASQAADAVVFHAIERDGSPAWERRLPGASVTAQVDGARGEVWVITVPSPYWTAPGPQEATLIAISLADGAILGQVSLGSVEPPLVSLGDTLHLAPEDVWIAMDGHAWRIDRATVTVGWRQDLDLVKWPKITPQLRWGVSGRQAALVADGIVALLGPDGVRWTLDYERKRFIADSADITPTRLVAGYRAPKRTAFVAVDLETGKETWRLDRTEQLARPGGRGAVVGESGGVFASSGKLVRFGLADGKIAEETNLNNVHYGVLGPELDRFGNLALLRLGDAMVAMNADTGAVAWKVDEVWDPWEVNEVATAKAGAIAAAGMAATSTLEGYGSDYQVTMIYYSPRGRSYDQWGVDPALEAQMRAVQTAGLGASGAMILQTWGAVTAIQAAVQRPVGVGHRAPEGRRVLIDTFDDSQMSMGGAGRMVDVVSLDLATGATTRVGMTDKAPFACAVTVAADLVDGRMYSSNAALALPCHEHMFTLHASRLAP